MINKKYATCRDVSREVGICVPTIRSYMEGWRFAKFRSYSSEDKCFVVKMCTEFWQTLYDYLKMKSDKCTSKSVQIYKSALKAETMLKLFKNRDIKAKASRRSSEESEYDNED